MCIQYFYERTARKGDCDRIESFSALSAVAAPKQPSWKQTLRRRHD
jgi:hypothetical protein